MTVEERANLPFQEILNIGKSLQTEGNGHYKDLNYWWAVKKYRKAINFLEDYPVVGEEDDGHRSKQLHFIYANLAQVYLKLERPQQACVACKLGLKLAEGPDRIKLLYRSHLRLRNSFTFIDRFLSIRKAVVRVLKVSTMLMIFSQVCQSLF